MTLCVKVISVSRGRRRRLPPTRRRNRRGSDPQDYSSFLHVLVILAEARIQLSHSENRTLIYRFPSLQRQLGPRFREGDGLPACHFRGRRGRLPPTTIKQERLRQAQPDLLLSGTKLWHLPRGQQTSVGRANLRPDKCMGGRVNITPRVSVTYGLVVSGLGCQPRTKAIRFTRDGWL